MATKTSVKPSSKIKLKPIGDRVVILAEEAETKTKSGLFIPDNAQEKPQRGTVLAVGPGTKDVVMTVKVGDAVLYGKYSGTEISVEGCDYLIMKETDIFAIIK